MSRTGFGFDSHLFAAHGHLKLGGLTFQSCPALKGHSDGDALLHAVIDALLGAAGLGDIGDYFSDRSKKFKGISSVLLLREALKRIHAAGWRPEFVDVTVLASAPRLGSKKKIMKTMLAKHLGVHGSQINIKAKTQEGLQWFVQPGGIAVWAIAMIVKKK